MLHRASRLLAVCAVGALALVCTGVVGRELNGDVTSRLSKTVIEVDQLYSKQLHAAAADGLTPDPPVSVGTISSNDAYHADLAALMMWHSSAAYCTDDPALQDWSCTACAQFGPFTVTQVMNDTANEGYVGYFTQDLPFSPIDDGTGVSASGPFVVIAFRGTVQTIEDWIEDLSFSKLGPFSSSYPDVGVHSGFWTAYLDLKPSLMTGLAAALKATNAQTILVAGHSLGAAMAELAAVDLKLNEYPDLHYASFTQGCPRVGNPAWSSLVSGVLDSSFREVHHADIVPHLPPKLLGFEHGPLEIWWDESFVSYSVCNSTMSGEDPSCSDSLALPISVADHLTYRNIDISAYCTDAAATAAAAARPLKARAHERAPASVPAPRSQEQATATPKRPKAKVVLEE